MEQKVFEHLIIIRDEPARPDPSRPESARPWRSLTGHFSVSSKYSYFKFQQSMISRLILSH